PKASLEPPTPPASATTWSDTDQDGAVQGSARRDGRCSGGTPDGDERLGLPVLGQIERALDDFGAEQGSAHPAGAQAVNVEGQQQVLDGGANALNGHVALGYLAPLVGVAVQVALAHAHHYQRAGLAQAHARALELALDEAWAQLVLGEVLLPPLT